MLRIGLTGGIGSGKSTVARVFAVLGVPLFDADRAGRQLLNDDPAARAAVIEAFGDALYASGSLDRRALAAIVFTDPEKLARLNAIVHPAVRVRFASWAAEQQAPYVMMESAILAETGGHHAFDRIVLVDAPEAVRLRRVMLRDAVGEEEVRARMARQGTDAQRAAIAHHIIRNDDTELVVPQVLRVHEALLGEAG
jgi:dephospho-CoA kinase